MLSLWTNQIVWIWTPHLHENGSVRNHGAGTLLYISRPCLCLSGAPCLCLSQVCKLNCNTWAATLVLFHSWTVLLNKVSPVLHPKLGTLVGTELADMTFDWRRSGKRSKEPTLGLYLMQWYGSIARVPTLHHAFSPPAFQESYPWPWLHSGPYTYLDFTYLLPIFPCLQLYFPHFVAHFHSH